MNQLVDLHEELDLPDSAPAALQVEAGAEGLAARIMIPDQVAHRLDFADRAEIKAAAPHEGVDCVEEIATDRCITGAGAGADEGRALPGQGGGFVMADRRVHRQRDRRHFGGRTQAKVDAEGIAVLGPRLDELDDPVRQAHRGLKRLLPGLARQGFGIEEEQEIDVRGIIELAAAELAKRDDGEAARRFARRPLGDRGGNRRLQRSIGEAGERRRHLFQRHRPGEIGDAERERMGGSSPAKRPRGIGARILGGRERPGEIAGFEPRRDLGEPLALQGEEGRTGPCAVQCRREIALCSCLAHATGPARNRHVPRGFATPARVRTFIRRGKMSVQC